MADRLGPPDLVLCAGDIAADGEAVGYVAADGILDRLQGALRDVAPDVQPLVFAVPGASDVQPLARKRRRQFD